ncbi:MAG: chemotaxis protein CheW [Gemmatimonadales bacterium]|jgi:purine-binding chemotaxis protein CheW
MHDAAQIPGPGQPEEALGFEHAIGNSADAPRLLVFTAAGRTCACELSGVREIIPNRRATTLPGAPSFVTGLINLRGSIVTVLDLSARLGGPAVPAERGSIILVDAVSKVVGIVVDELRDVQRVLRSDIGPADKSNGEEGLASGVLRVGDEVVVLLDVARIVAHALL